MFFGYIAETPCSHCGTSRVGKDYDDHYYITPGYVREVWCQWEVRFQSEPTWSDYSPYRKGYTVACPECGGQITEEKVTSIATGESYWVIRCKNGGKKEFVPLQGCPKCSQSAHNYGIGLTGAE